MRILRKKKLQPGNKAFRFKAAIMVADLAIERGDHQAADLEIVDGLRFLDSEAKDFIKWNASLVSEAIYEQIGLKQWLGCSEATYHRLVQLANQRSLPC